MPGPAPNGCRRPLRIAALVLVLIALAEGALSASAADDPFAKRIDAGFAKVLIQAGVCTIALRTSTFTYATPYDCRTIVTDYQGRPLDEVPPEVVLARSLIARLAHDPKAVLACYEEESQEREGRKLVDQLSAEGGLDDPAHASVALIDGQFHPDGLRISYRITDRTEATKFSWSATLRQHDHGWRISNQTAITDLPTVFSSGGGRARDAHGELNEGELSRMSLFRILATPNVHAQLIQPPDLRLGDLALAVRFTAQVPPLPLAGETGAGGDPVLLALCHANRLYGQPSSDAELRGLWCNPDSADIHPSPFTGGEGTPPLRFCHGALRGDHLAIVLLGDGHQASSEIVLGDQDGPWRLEHVQCVSPADSVLTELAGKHHLWAQLYELLRKRGD